MRKLFSFLALGALLSIGLATSAGATALGGATLSVSLTGLPGASFIGTVSGTATSHGFMTMAAPMKSDSYCAAPSSPSAPRRALLNSTSLSKVVP